jgi:hypothetical protein
MNAIIVVNGAGIWGLSPSKKGVAPPLEARAFLLTLT